MAGGRRLGRRLTALIYALAVHVAILAVIGLSFNWKREPAAKQGLPQTEIVRARAVDEAAVERELARIDEAEQARASAERERLEELERTKKEAVDAERRRKAEEVRLAELREEQDEARRKAAQAEKQRKAEEQRIAEAKRKDEASKRKEEDLRRKAAAEVEKKRKAEEARKQAESERRRKEEEATLQARLAEEQREREAKSLFSNEFAPLIKQKVDRNWIRSASFAPGLKCTLAVRVTPGGEVLEARVIHSSGDPIFDRSAQNAVLKSTPLPMPGDQTVAARMTEFKFIFDPSRG